VFVNTNTLNIAMLQGNLKCRRESVLFLSPQIDFICNLLPSIPQANNSLNIFFVKEVSPGFPKYERFQPSDAMLRYFGQHFAVILFSRTSVNIEPLIMVSSLISCVAAVASREMKSMTCRLL